MKWGFALKMKDLKQDVRALLESYRARGSFTKAVCAVSKNGKTILELSMGCGLETFFDLGSVTEVYTTTAILHQEALGRLALEERLDRLLPFAPLGPATRSRFERLTVRDLLTHASGIPAWYPFYARQGSFWDVLEHVLSVEPPAQGPVHSDVNFMILGEVVRAKCAGLKESLADLNAAIGASSTYGPVDPGICAETENGNRAEAQRCADMGLPFEGFRPADRPIVGTANDGNAFYFFKGVAGHAGIFASARALLKLGRIYLDGGSSGDREWLRHKAVEEAFRDHGGGWGLGWSLSDVFPKGVGHASLSGPSLWLAPDRGIAAALLVNPLTADPAPDLSDLRRQLHAMLLQSL